jgi:hypothetical protein
MGSGPFMAGRRNRARPRCRSGGKGPALGLANGQLIVNQNQSSPSILQRKYHDIALQYYRK